MSEFTMSQFANKDDLYSAMQARIDELKEDILDLRQQTNYRCADVQRLTEQLSIAKDALNLVRESFSEDWSSIYATEALSAIEAIK